MASGQSPCSCRISARCTRHWPRYGTSSGCDAHHWLSAAVHSRARRTSKISWHVSITAQYTRPVIVGDVSSAVTATMASSSRVTPSAMRPSMIAVCPSPSRASVTTSGSPKRTPMSAPRRYAAPACSMSPMNMSWTASPRTRHASSTRPSTSPAKRCARASHPLAGAASPRSTRPTTSQNAHRTARAGSPARTQSWCARTQASVLAASSPARYAAVASRSRSSTSSGASASAAASWL